MALSSGALPAGPASSFLVISDPAAAKHVLRASDNPKNPIYDKGLVAEVSTSILKGASPQRCTTPIAAFVGAKCSFHVRGVSHVRVKSHVIVMSHATVMSHVKGLQTSCQWLSAVHMVCAYLW